MLEHYDFSKATKNPFAAVLNESRENNTVKLDDDVVAYFENMSDKNKIPYQTLINLYLADCMNNHRQLTMSWENK